MDENTAKQCLAICPLFEAELLVRLMLDRWAHPYATDESYRQQLLESTTEVLEAASHDSCTDVFIEKLPSNEMNFVAAVWYSELCALQNDSSEHETRQAWLDAIRRSLPSCFCSSDLLDP